MHVILFDGVCNLCNTLVNWIIDHDKEDQFHFASLQSAYGQAIVEKYKLQEDFMNTLVYQHDEHVYIRSTAALEILIRLGGVYSFASVFLIVPLCLRDWTYNIVARNRYSWFGKRESCRIPTPNLKTKFLD